MLGAEQTKRRIRLFAETNVTVLELAATIDWLWRSGGYKTDWRREITKRKGVKVQDGRIDKAVALLQQLDRDPP